MIISRHISFEWTVTIFDFAGEIVNLSLDKTTDANFRGFIIQARDAEENPIGSFQFEDDSVSQMTCGEGIHNSITHRNPDEKTGTPYTRSRVQWSKSKHSSISIQFVFLQVSKLNGLLHQIMKEILYSNTHS